MADSLKFYVNDDQLAFFNREAAMDEASLRAHVDGYADAGIGTIAFCNRGHRANYRSDVLEAQWDPLLDGSQPNSAWCRNLKALFDAGIDPYAVWLDQCRRRGVKGWLSIRMNDCHQSNPVAFSYPDRRWFTRPDWRNIPDAAPANLWENNQYYGRENCCYLQLQPALCWNYAHPDVQALMMAFLSEEAERYAPDAFELDFTRFPYCLRPGRYYQDAHCITELIQAFRRKLDDVDKQRGRRTAIAVRVPWTPENAIGWGFRVDDWARLGLVDTVVPAPFRRSFQYDCRLDDWRAILPDSVTLAPSVDMWVPSSDFTVNSLITAPFLRGWCDAVAASGVTDAYLFNFFFWVNGECGNPPLQGFPEMYRQGLSLEKFRHGDRRYQIGYVDFPAPGMLAASEMPRFLLSGRPVEFKFPIGDVPASGRVAITPVFDPEPAAVVIDTQLNGQRDIDVKNLRPGVNTVTLTAAHQVRLTNVYLDITDVPRASSPLGSPCQTGLSSCQTGLSSCQAGDGLATPRIVTP